MARETTNKNEERDRLLDELLKGKTPERGRAPAVRRAAAHGCRTIVPQSRHS
jgi:hypothetical protein